MKRTAKVVIIGGGIQGISLAYHLAKKGLSDVLVLEMNTLGSGSSGRSASIIGHAFQGENCLRLTQISLAAFLRFQDELGADPGYDPIGYLVLGGWQHASQLRQDHALYERLDIESQLLDREGISELTPGLNLEDIEVGLLNVRAGCLDPHSIMMAYAHHARCRGVEFAEGVKATGLQTQNDRVTGVHTTEGLVATPCVVNAAGFRARQVAAWAHLDLPITNYKRHIFVTGPVAAYSGSIPFTYDAAANWYMRREGPGLIIGMGSMESDEEDPQVDWSFLDELVEHSIFRAPPLAEAGMKNAWAGLRSITADKDPILGPVSTLAGFVNDCGWGGHGVMHAPAGGQAVAEWIVDGEASAIDLGPFRAERFEMAGEYQK
jgi:sarcosine oxidase subunit beta